MQRSTHKVHDEVECDCDVEDKESSTPAVASVRRHHHVGVTAHKKGVSMRNRELCVPLRAESERYNN